MVVSPWMAADLDYEWVVENGWSLMPNIDVCPWLPFGGDQGVSSIDTNLDYVLNAAYDYGVDFKIQVTSAVSWNRGNGWWSPPYLDPVYKTTLRNDALYTDLNAGIAHLDSKDGMVGYWYEGAWDEGAAWLRDTTDLDICMGLFQHGWLQRGMQNDPLTGHGGEQDLDDRFTNDVDGVMIEVWRISDIYDFKLNEAARYIHKNFPNLSLGLDSSVGTPAGTELVQAWRYWRTRDAPAGWLSRAPSTQESLDLYKFHLTRFKEYLGFPFDTLMAELDEAHWYDGMVVDGTSITTEAQFLQTFYDFQDSVGLQTAGTAGNILAQDMITLGADNSPDSLTHSVKPYYVGAGSCNSTATNTFVNTGNEILMVKSNGTTATAHTISVGDVEYTLTISPTRPVFLGTFPLEQFGASPTITYDNYDVMVTVIKET